MYKGRKYIGIRIFFLTLFLSYYADITFFTHSHIIHGVTIVHSHYSCDTSSGQGNKTDQHAHPESALTLISQANSWAALLLQSPEIPDGTIIPIHIYHCGITLSPDQATPSLFYLRGPPAKG